MESSTISAKFAHNLIDSMFPIQNIADSGQFIAVQCQQSATFITVVVVRIYLCHE